MPSRRTLVPAALACLVACAAIAPAAEAQQPKKGEEAVRMPSPRRSDDPPTLWAYFVVAIALGVVFGANMIPSKRGHQD